MMQFHHPPPPIPNLGVPPPPLPQQPHFTPRFQPQDKVQRMHFYQPYRPYPRPGPDNEFDGKRLRKSVMRKTVDYNSSIIKMLEGRVWQRDFRDYRALQPDLCYYPELYPPPSYVDNAINSVTTKFVKTATNKMRCPIFCLAWTPEGRRLVTGASSGEFTLWNGLTFNFETILQAHDSPVRTMVWSHNDVWMVTGDHSGYVKYWQSNMNNVKMFQAHKEAIRGLSFSPTDQKFATCSDDGTIRIWDFYRCNEERILRGHGADVKCCHWHPQKGLIISGSKDNQQPVKLWDPKTGQSLATLHAHKSTVMDIKWNQNGNWLVTASRDHLLKLFDLRNLSQEVQTFRGHKKEASSVAWHPYHEGLFCSGGSDGAILFWHVGADKEVGAIEQAHDSIVWSLAWHPLGHILCSGSNDHTSKFWTRNRPGDTMTDKYNLNTLPAGAAGQEDAEVGEASSRTIPGMGPEDRVEILPSDMDAQIPGLDFENVQDNSKPQKKVPYAKPIPKNFQAQWNETKGNEDGKTEEDDSEDSKARHKDMLSEAISQLAESNPPRGMVPLTELQPSAIIVYGKVLPVEPNSALATAIAAGSEELRKLIKSGEIEELQDVVPPDEDEGSINGDKDWSELEPWCHDDNSMESNEVTGVASGNPEELSNLASGDQDMRSLGGSMFEGIGETQEPQHVFGDKDLRVMSDQDLRKPPAMYGQDQDFRQNHPPMLGQNPPMLGPGPMMPPLFQEMRGPRPEFMDSGNHGQFGNMGRQGSPAGRRMGPPNHEMGAEGRDVDLRGSFSDFDQRNVQFGFPTSGDMDDRRHPGGGLPMREPPFDRGRGAGHRGGINQGDWQRGNLWGSGPNGKGEMDNFYDDKDERGWRKEDRNFQDEEDNMYDDDDEYADDGPKQGLQRGFSGSRDDMLRPPNSRGFDSERESFGNLRGGFDNSRSGFDNMRGNFGGMRAGMRGGGDNSRGGFNARTGLDAPGGRSGFQNSRSGFDNLRGGLNNPRGGRGSSGRGFRGRGGRGGRGRGRSY